MVLSYGHLQPSVPGSGWHLSHVPDHTASPLGFAEHSRSSQTQGCTSCGKTFSSYFKTEPIYQLPCGHLMCRPCLAEKQKALSILCASCKRSVATHDIRRVHF